MTKKMLTFDYGASSGRGILGEYDGSKLQISELHRFSNDPVSLCGHLHWDFPRLFFELKTGMTRAAIAGHRDISSVGVDTWGVDFGLLDGYDMLVGNPFHYRDVLTEGELEEVFRTVPRRELYARTGLQFLRFNTLIQLHAVRRKFPLLLERAKTLLLAPDLLNFLLSGVKSAEFSMVSTTQMYNLQQKNWDRELLHRLDIRSDILADIISSGTLLGPLLPEVAEETGLCCDVISVCGHDTGSAFLAVPIRRDERSAILSCGTWSLLGVELASPLATDAAYEIEYTNEGGYGGTTRFLKNIMGLWIYQEVKREYERREGEIGYRELDRMILDAPPFAAFIDPDDDTFMSPGRMIEKVQQYCSATGQTAPETLGGILRTVLESLAMKYRMSLMALEQVLGYPLPALRVVGGGCKDKILMRFTANALQRPVLAGPVEATAVGNLSAQLLASGDVKDVWQAREIVARSFDVDVYQPGDGALWNDQYDYFQNMLENKGR